MTCNEWLESQRINGGPHGFECIGSERMQQVWNAAQSDCANRLRMTRDELIVIALVAGFPTWWIDPPEPERKGMTLPMLELFAELIGKRATMEVVQCKQ